MRAWAAPPRHGIAGLRAISRVRVRATHQAGHRCGHNADCLAHDSPLSAFFVELVCTVGATPPRTATSPPPNGGNCSIRAATRRRHAEGRLLMVQNPHHYPWCPAPSLVQDCPVRCWLNAMARHLQPQAIQARERAQVRAIRGSSGHVEVFHMDGVGTSIILTPTRPRYAEPHPTPLHPHMRRAGDVPACVLRCPLSVRGRAASVSLHYIGGRRTSSPAARRHGNAARRGPSAGGRQYPGGAPTWQRSSSRTIGGPPPGPRWHTRPPAAHQAPGSAPVLQRAATRPSVERHVGPRWDRVV